MRFKNALAALLFLPQLLAAQNFTSYFTGDTADVATPVFGGTVLMGGATENDNAMRWFLDRSGGGDILVLRASGADGYNDYLFSDLGKTVNSVESIVFHNALAAADPYVLKQIKNAEAIWLAGGDQTKYIDFWKNNAVEAALQAFVSVKKGPIGGTSAGMAVLGEGYFYAKNGTVYAAAALADPFNSKMSLGKSDFVQVPFLQKVVTDTHYDSPDRRGRHFAFIARFSAADGTRWRGIACEEYTAVCIDTAGIARVFGTTGDPDFAWFLQANCAEPFLPETLTAGSPLVWQRGGAAVKGYQVKGNDDGGNFFDLNDWKSGSGGFWFDWSAKDGLLTVASGADAPDCTVAATGLEAAEKLRFYPNPSRDGLFWLETGPFFGKKTLEVFDVLGQKVAAKVGLDGSLILPENLPNGAYFVRVATDGKAATGRIALRK